MTTYLHSARQLFKKKITKKIHKNSLKSFTLCSSRNFIQKHNCITQRYAPTVSLPGFFSPVLDILMCNTENTSCHMSKLGKIPTIWQKWAFHFPQKTAILILNSIAFSDTGGSSLFSKIDYGTCGRILDLSSPKISCFWKFLPVKKWKEQGKKLKHKQEFVPEQNRKSGDVF